MISKYQQFVSKLSKPFKILLITLCISIPVAFFYQEFSLNESLWSAAGNGDLQQVKSLLAGGANPNDPFEGLTALDMARYGKHAEIEAVLRKAGAKSHDELSK